MNKKSFLLGLVLLLAGRLFAAEEMHLITLSADGTEKAYVLSKVQKIVFQNDRMTVNMKSGSDVTDVSCISFLLMEPEPTGLENLKPESPIFVFPNPVKTSLTVTGIAKDLKINLLDLSGVLLQSIPAQENSTNIDVSSLQQGVYILQTGDKVVKFIKQ